MKITPVQEGFTAGEMSPLMLARVDTEGYKSGAHRMLNMLPDSRGPARTRGGFEFDGEMTTASDGRIINIPINDQYGYAALFTENVLVVDSVLGLSPGNSYNINPRFDDGALGWNPTTSGTAGNPEISFGLGLCNMTINKGNQGAWAYISQEIIVNFPGTVHMNIVSDRTNVPYNVKVGTTENGNDLLDLTITGLIGGIDVPVSSSPVWISIELMQDLDIDAELVVDFYYASDAEASGQTFATPYLDNEIRYLYHVADPSGDRMYILHPNHVPHQLTYDPVLNTFDWVQVPFLNPPAEWTGTNYPRAGSFFEGRLWLGGCKLSPQTFWGSKSGSSLDFTLGDLDDDAIQFTMAQYGRIVWMQGFKNLLVGTTNGEHILTSEGGYISPSDIQVTQQSAYGSAPIQPEQVGDQVFYVSPDGLKLRAIQYEWQADNWLSRDLTFISEHITASGIKHIAWLQNPGNVFVCTLLDGTVATMIYDRTNNIYGWSRADTQGQYKDIAAILVENGFVQATALTNRKPGLLYLERQNNETLPVYMDSWARSEPGPNILLNLISNDEFLLDSFDGFTLQAWAADAEHVGPSADQNWFAGPAYVQNLSHLNGLVCQVLIDGAVHPDVIPQDGYAELEWGGQTAYIGLGYDKQLWTMPVEMGSPRGSGMPFTKRYNKFYVRLYDSPRPLVNDIRAPDRRATTLMNASEWGITEDVMTPVTLNDKYNIIRIEQPLPLPLRVLGVYGELAQSII